MQSNSIHAVFKQDTVPRLRCVGDAFKDNWTHQFCGMQLYCRVCMLMILVKIYFILHSIRTRYRVFSLETTYQHFHILCTPHPHVSDRRRGVIILFLPSLTLAISFRLQDGLSEPHMLAPPISRSFDC